MVEEKSTGPRQRKGENVKALPEEKKVIEEVPDEKMKEYLPGDWEDDNTDDEELEERPQEKHGPIAKCLCVSFLSSLFVVLILMTLIGVRYTLARSNFLDPTLKRTRYGMEPETPILEMEHLKPLVNDLPYPAAKVAPGSEKVYFTYHSLYSPEVKVVEHDLKTKETRPFPDEQAQQNLFVTPHAIKFSEKLGLVYVLDHGLLGISSFPKLYVFDSKTNALKHTFEFQAENAGMGSFLSDFRVSPDGKYVYICDTSIILDKPAVLVLNTETNRLSTRLLADSQTTWYTWYTPVVGRFPARFLYTFALLINLNTIEISSDKFYYSSMNSNILYELPLQLLKDAVDSDEPSKRIIKESAINKRFAKKTMSNSIARHENGDFYIADVEHSSIVKLHFDRRPTRPKSLFKSLIRDRPHDTIKWIEDVVFDPKQNFLYVTDSHLECYFCWLPCATPPYSIYRLDTKLFI